MSKKLRFMEFNIMLNKSLTKITITNNYKFTMLNK